MTECVARFGLEYETLLEAKTDPMQQAFRLITNEIPIIQHAKGAQYLTNSLHYLLDRKDGCEYQGAEGEVLDVNVLAQILNDKANISDNKLFFKVTDGYKMDACFAPNSGLEKSEAKHKVKLGDTIDNKYTWLVTQDSSVKYMKSYIDDDGDEVDVNPIMYSYYTNDHDDSLLPNSVQEEIKDIKVVNGIEIVSPPLTVPDDLSYVESFLKLFDRTGLVPFNNQKTSNHVHMTFSPSGTELPIWVNDADQLLKICMGWWYFEPIFFLLCGYWRRDNQYAEGMARIMEEKYNNDRRNKLFKSLSIHTFKQRAEELEIKFAENLNFSEFQKRQSRKEDSATIDIVRFNNNQDALKQLVTIIMMFQGHPGDHSCRYAGLNLLNTITKVGTIEVRIKHGSTDPDDIKNWITLLHLFFQALLKQPDTINTLFTDKDKEEVYKIVSTPFSGTPLEKTKQTRQNSKISITKLFNTLFNSLINDDSLKQYYGDIFCKNLGILGADPCTLGTEQFVLNIQDGGAKKTKQYKLFCYGSNNTQQLSERVGAKQGKLTAEPGWIKGYTRIFAGYSAYWKGGVATIHPSPKHKVHGSVVELTASQLKKLDKYELGYSRKKIQVVLGSDSSVEECFVYIRDDSEYRKPPSNEYLAAIKKMLTEVGWKSPRPQALYCVKQSKLTRLDVKK